LGPGDRRRGGVHHLRGLVSAASLALSGPRDIL
jgi:hypothetical protein